MMMKCLHAQLQSAALNDSAMSADGLGDSGTAGENYWR